MACGTIQNRAVGDIFSVMDEDCPDLHEGEKSQVGKLLQWEDEREEVVGQRLRPSVNGVESNSRIWGRHNPFVVRLVHMFVDRWVVQASVDPVDQEVGEKNEEWELY